ncbi:MAG: hypothetical protein VCB26_08335 [Candidatus Hydrogenedentota bacterium]
MCTTVAVNASDLPQGGRDRFRLWARGDVAIAGPADADHLNPVESPGGSLRRSLRFPVADEVLAKKALLSPLSAENSGIAACLSDAP